MIGNTHIAIGLLTAVGAKELLDIPITPIDAVICVLGALLPDIDEPSSTISKPGNLLFPFIPRSLAKFLNFLSKLISKIINWVFGHRSITHWPIIAVLLLLLSLEFDSTKFFMFALGFSSHLLGDICTTQGIPFWAPLSFKKISWLRIRVGGNAEIVFSTFLWLGLLYYFLVGSSLNYILD